MHFDWKGPGDHELGTWSEEPSGKDDWCLSFQEVYNVKSIPVPTKNKVHYLLDSGATLHVGPNDLLPGKDDGRRDRSIVTVTGDNMDYFGQRHAKMVTKNGDRLTADFAATNAGGSCSVCRGWSRKESRWSFGPTARS